MKQIGLRQPITIRVVDDYVGSDGQKADGVPVLVAGYHRLEAARILGWEKIDAIDADDDDLSAELWEIAENLHRHDLSKEQRDEHIRRYAELLEARQVTQNAAPVSKLTDGRSKGPQHEKGIPRQIAEETGLSVDTVRRALKPKPVHHEPPKEVHDVHDQARRRMMSAWNNATEEDRQWFRDWIDSPVMG
ncbi:hypothetical protein [Sphingobium chungbukense]